MSRFKGCFIARLAVVIPVAISLALMLGGCGDGGDDGNPADNPNNDDNYTYNGDIVDIGGKKWMSKNLDRATADSWCYGEGSVVYDKENETSITLSGAEIQANCATYGRLYTWDAAQTACPAGWRLPDTSDWNALVAAVGDLSTADGKLKAESPDWDGTDDYEFSALPGGLRYPPDGIFGSLGSMGYWWTATEEEPSRAYYRYMYSGDDPGGKGSGGKDAGASVRCVQD